MILTLGIFSMASIASAQSTKDFELTPINYHARQATDRIARLQDSLDRGKRKLTWSARHGFLPDVLGALNIPISSQVLVYSKTSVQVRHISPRRPRAVYFNDDTYVAWVQGGDLLEIISMDPQLGGIFYTLSQRPVKAPRFRRDRGQCLLCHANRRTNDVPGPVVRSLFTSPSGQPHFGARTFVTDHTSPFSQRWGGYYVTGTHGAMRHMGNSVIPLDVPTSDFNYDTGANLTSIDGLVDADDYLSPHSDIVALMVLEHQSRMHNLITRAHFEADTVDHYDELYNKALDRPRGYRSGISKRRIARVVNDLLRYLLFVDEFTLREPVRGTSSFATNFARRRTHAGAQSRLRQFDLRKRLFQVPCSYLVHSPSMAAIPESLRVELVVRLKSILDAKKPVEGFTRLSDADRKTIRSILDTTRPAWWTPPRETSSQAKPPR
tara:strand:+ start:254 stop:1564 length:1311 start_codon:yes stop_codon:yes gene_type:complete